MNSAEDVVAGFHKLPPDLVQVLRKLAFLFNQLGQTKTKGEVVRVCGKIGQVAKSMSRVLRNYPTKVFEEITLDFDKLAEASKTLSAAVLVEEAEKQETVEAKTKAVEGLESLYSFAVGRLIAVNSKLTVN